MSGNDNLIRSLIGIGFIVFIIIGFFYSKSSIEKIISTILILVISIGTNEQIKQFIWKKEYLKAKKHLERNPQDFKIKEKDYEIIKIQDEDIRGHQLGYFLPNVYYIITLKIEKKEEYQLLIKQNELPEKIINIKNLFSIEEEVITKEDLKKRIIEKLGVKIKVYINKKDNYIFIENIFINKEKNSIYKKTKKNQFIGIMIAIFIVILFLS